MLWFSMDIFLWTKSSLLFLFENGPNNAINQLLPNHIKKVKHILLPYVYYIDGLAEIILSYNVAALSFSILIIS